MKHTNQFILKCLFVAAIIGFNQSCIDLEEDVSSVLSLGALSGEADIEAALSPIYREFQKTIDKPQDLQITGFGSDDVTTWWAGNKAPLRVFDRFDYGDGENSDINWLPVAWNGYWKTIYYANNLIKGLQTSTAPQEIVVAAEGEARFLRALSYFSLVRAYGNVPIILEDDTPTGDEVRATILDNYLAIENDLKMAESLLPAPGATANVGRVSSGAAKALLSSLYLTWAGWPVKDASKYAAAATKAKEVIDMNYFTLLPINELWLLENQNSTESLFSIQFSETENIQSSYPSANSFHEARGWSDMYPERQFFFDFPEGPRKEATFVTEIPQRRIDRGQIVAKSPATKPWQESQRNHPMYKKFTIGENLDQGGRTSGFRAVEVIRYAEVLLIYAEAQARTNGDVASGDGLEALNQIKRRAMGFDYLTPNAEIDVMTATADEIVAEKGWELAGEFKRWHDLVRLEKVAEAMMRRDPTEEVSLAIDPSEIGAKHYIAPIPFKAISTSSLTQNPTGFKVQ